MKHVIIDTDPGIDDALAILLAFSSPELIVEALTTVVGNVSLRKANVNALKLLEFLGRDDVPVAPGADRALLRDTRDASEFHGINGLGEASLPEPKAGISSKSAVSVILEKVEELGEELTVIAIGPLTNIATAILVEPSLAMRVGGLVIMGGAFAMTPYGHGNANAVAEFNVWHDPEAAKIVFNSGIPMKAIGLDVTTNPENRLTKEAYDEIEELDTRRSRLVADLGRGLVKRLNGLNLHDPLAVATMIDPSIAETLRCKVDVETKGEYTRGMTVVDRRRYRRVAGPEANVDVCVTVDSGRFHRMFRDRVAMGGA